jgi:hypothetical protein
VVAAEHLPRVIVPAWTSDGAPLRARALRGRLLLELPTQDRILAAARIKAHHAMAYADAFACATALAHDAALLTGDPEIVSARDLDVAVVDLRRV